MTRIAGYCRLSVSTDQSVSIDGQRAVIDRWAEGQGSPVAEWYIDDGFSGSKDIERPAYDRLSADVAAGLFDVVAVKSLDRLGRRLRAFLEFADLAQSVGCRVVAVESGLDTGTPTGRMMLSLLSVFAEHEAAQMGERQKVSQEQRRKAGRALGAAGFGYRNVKRDDGTFREIDPEQADIVREIAARLTDGDSYAGVAAWLNDNGVRSSKGAPFSASQVAQMINNPALNGQRMAGRMVKGPDGKSRRVVEPVRDASGLPIIDEHLQILTHTQWAALGEALGKRSQFAPRTRQGREPLLLTGIAVCDACGKPLGQSEANGHPAYRCIGRIRRTCSETASVKAASLDAFVLSQFDGMKDWPVTEWRVVEDREAVERLAFLQREIDALAGRMSSASADEVIDLAGRITDLRQQADAVTVERRWEQVDTGQTFAQMLEDNPRRVIDLALEQVRVRRARSSHEPVDGRVTLVWRETPEPE